MIWKTRAFALAAAALGCATAHGAPVVAFTTSDATVYAQFNGFESAGTLANNALITNQFQAQGLTVTGTLRANGCGTVPSNGWTSLGMAGQNYVGNFGPSCITNNTLDSFSLKFASDLNRLALDIESYSGSGSNTIQLLNDGVLVGSYNLATVNYAGLAMNSSQLIGGRNFDRHATLQRGILTLAANGSAFDELRLVESAQDASYGNYVFFDNLRYDLTPTTPSQVPEPASLLLAGLGLGAAALSRRRRV